METEKLPFELDYMVLPRPVACAVMRRHIKMLELMVYAIIQNYTRSPRGCFVSNARFALECNTAPTKITQAISNLKKMGFVVQESFDGRKRYLRAVGYDASVVNETPKKPRKKTASPDLGEADHTKSGEERSIKFNKQLSRPTVRESDGGFGMVENTTKASQFDIDIATKLFHAIKKLPPRTTKVGRAKPAAWAKHIRLLRTIDEVDETTIEKVMDWYTHHIGEEFVPEAYAGESFRKKFAAIERQYGRDLKSAIEVSPEAATLAERLATLAWPMGSGESVPAATQACLTAYTTWVRKQIAFVNKLRRNDLKDCYGKERQRLLRLGDHLVYVMPPPAHFVRLWMEHVNGQVHGWDDWSGELGPLVFKPEASRWRNMGRGWANDYAHDPDRWDRFCEVMQSESE